MISKIRRKLSHAHLQMQAGLFASAQNHAATAMAVIRATPSHAGPFRRRLAQSGSDAGLFAVLALLFALPIASAKAQTARLAGELTTFGGTALSSVVGQAVDVAQNVYVVTSAGAVYKETYKATGSYTESLLFTTASNSGSGIAVDGAGTHIYVGTGTGHSVAKYTGSGTSYSLTTTITGFTGLTAPAVDTSGNVYVADQLAGSLVKEVPSGASYTGTTIVSGLTSPSFVAQDGSGNVFVNTGLTTIDEVSGSGTTYTATAAITTLSGIAGLGVDSSDDLFVQTSAGVAEAVSSGGVYASSPYYQYSGKAVALDSQGNVYLAGSTDAFGTKLTIGSGYLNFGQVGPGAPVTMTVAFTLTSGTTGTLGTPTVVTQGLTGYDFALGSSSTCTGFAVTAGQSCTVVIQFQPQASGSRLGAVNLIGSDGTSTIASSFLGGVGFAPLAVYQSVTLLNTISTTLSQGRGITVDPAGNVFVANSTANQILKFPAGSTTPIVFATSSSCSPVGTAVDGEGNVFFTCNGEKNMYELVGGAGTPVAIPVGYTTDDHLSVDSAGNLYPTAYSPSNLFLKVAAGTHVVSVIATAPSGARFVGAVTDANGNTFAPDYNNDILYELPAGSNTLITLFSGSPLQAPHAIAEDAAGNLYVTTTTPNTSGNGTSNLLRFNAGNYTATPATIAVPGADSLFITPNGNFYTIFNNATLAVYSRSLFALTYARTPVGQTSATQTVTLENDGSAPLTISPPSSGTNPSISTNFTLESGSTCPQLSTGSTAATLTVGSSCTQILAFTPLQAGSISGALVTTDNSANVAGSVQTINMTGTATQGTLTVSVANVSGTLGQSATLTATISGGGVLPTGAVSFVVGSGASVPATCTAGTSSETCTAAYPTASGPTAGANTITASIVADTNYAAASGTGTLTLAPAPTSTSVTSSLNPSTFGASVTFTASVSSKYGTPTGSVNFLDGTTVLGSGTLSGTGTAMATFSISTLGVGSHPITATYTGVTSYATSTSSPALAQVVNQGTGTNTLGSSNLSPNFGSSVTFTDTLQVLGGVAPTGTIKFYLNGTTLLASVGVGSSGVTALPTTLLPVGTNENITAVYGGDGNYTSTTSAAVVENVGKDTGYSNALTASPTSSTFGQSVVLTDTLPTVNGISPTGTVTFNANGTFVGTGTLVGGVATLTTTALPTGSPDTLTAVYSGDANFTNSTSNSLPFTVAKIAATTADTATGTGTYGAATTGVTVTIPYGGPVAPTGAITVTDTHGNTLSLVASACTATGGSLTCTGNMTTANVPGGADTVTVRQAADTNYSGSSGTGTVTINKAAGATTDSATGSGVYGAATTSVTVSIPFSGVAAPTGTVTVADAHGNTVSLAGTACSAASGVLTCTVTLPTASELGGANAVTVNQAADGNYTASSGTGTVTLSKAPLSTRDTATGSGTYGAVTTPVTVTIPYVGSAAPTGAITLADSYSNTLTFAAGSCTSSNGTQTCTVNFPTASEPLAANAVTITQAGDANYLGSSGTGTVTIAKAAATTGDTATGTGVYGAATTAVTVTIPFAGSAAPAGTITLSDTHGNSVNIAAASCAAGTASLVCNVNLPTANEPGGANTVNIRQAADTNYSGSTGTGTITIKPAAATTGDTAVGTGTYGAASTPVSVSIPFAGTAAPTGTVTVTDTHGNTASVAGTACSAASGVLTCAVTLPTANVAGGSDPVTVSQAADTNYGGSTGSGTVTIGPAAGSTRDSATGSGTYGLATTPVTVTIPYAGAVAPTGAITLSDTYGNTLTIAAGSCTSSNGTQTCTAAFPTANEPVAANTVSISQVADSNYSASSGTGTITISKSGATVGDTATGTGTYGAATTAVTVTIPFTGSAAPTGTITVSDTHGNSVNIAAASCTTGSGALNCTGNLPTANEPAGANSVSVKQAADTNYSGSTGSGTVTLNKAAGTSGDTASGNGTYGAPSTPVTVTIPFAGVAAPTGTVTVSDTHGNTASVSGTACSAANGVLTCSITLPTASELGGSNAVTVNQAGDDNYSGSSGSGTVTIAPAPTTTRDTAAGTGVYGAATTSVTVTVPYVGSVAPVGAIVLADTYGNTLTIAAASCISASGTQTCTANFPTASEPVGANSVSITQAADSNYGGSSGTGTITINKAGPTGGDSATGTGTYGAATAAVRISIPYTGPGTPTGAVTLADAHGNTVTIAASVCTAGAGALSCTANLPTANLLAGSDPLTVTQAADTSYGGSTGSGTLTITKAPATTNDTASGTGTYGAATTAVTVSIPYVGVAAPTGPISVTDTHGNTVSAAASTCTASGSTLACAVSLPTANDPVGANAVTVSESGDSNFNGSTGAGTVTIAKAPSTTTDTGTGSGTYGAATTPVVLTIPYAGAAAPTGAITVSDSFGNVISIVASTCVPSGGALTCTANLPTANEPTGANPFNISQAGDNNYLGSTGTGTVTIGQAGGSGNDSATGSGSYGAPSTPITVVIPFAGVNAPTGAITVGDGFSNSVAIAASSCRTTGGALVCSASLPTANEPVGANPVTVAEAADANHGSSTGAGTISINKAQPTTADTAVGTGTYGAATTPVTVTIPYAGSASPAGGISVTDSLGETVAVQASACSAASQNLTCLVNLPTANEQFGPNQVSITQAADGNYSGSTGNGTVTISTSSVSPVGSSSAGVQNVTITQGSDPTLLTATLSYTGSMAPTGAVSFTVAGGAPVTASCTTGTSPEICTATYSTGALTVGTYTITANEAADANYAAGSATGTLTVAAGAVSPILDTISDVSNVLITAGTPSATLTASIVYNGPVPTGALTFNLPGGTPVTANCTTGPSPLVCTVTYPTASLGVGTYVITATDAGDGNYPQGAATALLTVEPSASTPAAPILTTGSNVSSVLVPYGTSTATLTATILYSGPAPAGAVTFAVVDGTGTRVPASCAPNGTSLTCTGVYPTATLNIGGYQIQVNEAADANYPAGSAIGTLTVTQAAASTGDSVTGTGTYGAATTLVTVTIPYAGAIAPTGAVTVTDSFSNTVTISSSTCAAANGALTCSANLPTANATVGSDSATVSQAADTVYAASTGTGSITIDKAIATTADAATGTGTYGAATTPVTVTIPYAGTAAPTGAVTISDSFGNTATVAATSCTATGGVLTCPMTLPTLSEPLGSNPVSVSQAGDSNYSGSTGSGIVSISKAGASGGDTATGTGTYGAPMTAVTVTIPYAGSTAPTGGITVTDTHGNTVNVASAGCAAGNGTLTCTANLPTASEPVGGNTVSVTQTADANYAGSNGTGTVTINKAPATTSDAGSGTGTYGAATTTVTVTIPYVGTTAPTGPITLTDSLNETVTVQASTCTAAAGVLSCTANLPTVSEPVGSNPVTVTQAGDGNYSGSTGTGTVSIGRALATNTDTAKGNGTYGVATTPVTVTIPYAGTTAPSGSITVSDSFGETVTIPATSCTSAAGVLACAVNLPSASEPVGSNPVTVSQAGDTNYNGSTGAGTVTISKATASGGTATGTGTYGAPTTLVTVTIPYAGSTAPTGAITLADTHGNTVTVANASCAASNSALTCTANLPTANDPVGGNAVTVSQAADASYSASTGSGSITINKAGATTNDTATGAGTYAAATTPVNVTIPYAGVAAPTGAVTVSDSFGNTATVPGASCSADSGVLTCVVTLATANEPLGSNPVTVTQVSDANYTGSTGSGAVTISKAGPTGGDSATGIGTYGAATTAITITVPYTGSAAPTGSITVADTHGNTVTVPGSGCTAAAGVLTCGAKLPTANEPVGANPVTVSQAADSNYSGSTGSGTVTINKAPATTNDTATGTGTYGAATTPVTVTIPYVGIAAPTGAVTVADSLGETVTVQGSACAAAAGVLSCTANLPTANEAVGGNTVTVSQAADVNYSGSTGSGTVTISKAAAGADTVTGTGTYGAAATAVNVTIPYTGAAPTGAISLTDAHGTTVTVSNCTANSGVLTCTANLPTGSDPVGANAVTVNQAADANHSASTGGGTVTINKAPVTNADAITGTGTYGMATTPVTVTIPYAGTAAPTGAITIADTVGDTITVSASSCTAAAGVLTCTANLPTMNEPLGTNQVTVSQAADANYSGSTGSGAVTINKPGATGGDGVTGTGTYGAATAPVTVTIPYSGSAAPTGTITLTDTHGDSTTLQASNCSAAKSTLTCSANFPSSNELVGSNTVTVNQAPDSVYNGSTGTGSITINKAAATTNDTATGSAAYGAATATVTVSIPYAGSAAPTGAITVADASGNTVTLQASACTAAKSVLTCSANLPAATIPVGTDALTVTQAADTNYSGSTGSGSISIGKTSPTLTAPTVSPMNAPYGTSVTMTQSVPSGETGTVTFFSGSTALGTATITNGVATLTTSALPQGTNSITATANGDTNYSAATSPAVTDNVGLVAAKISLNSSQGTSTFGSSVTFTANVTATPSSTIAGTVTFFDGTTVLGTGAVTNGTASFSTASLGVGSHAITASFTPATGSAVGAVTSASVNQVVLQVTSSIALTSSLNPAIVAQGVTFSATVPTSVAGTVPTGSVTFYDGTTVLGTTKLNGSGVASFSLSSLAGGMHQITAAYAGDANYATSTSGAVAQAISDYTVGNTTPTVGADPGATAAFNITVDPVKGVGFAAPVVLTVSGLPAHFTASFAPGTLTPGAGGTTATMTVQTFAQALTALQREQHIKSYKAAALWACLIPLLGLGRVRRKLPKVVLMLALCVASFGVVAPLTGCGGGYFGPAPTTYTLTVTGTNGTLQRSTTVTLNVH